MSSGRREDCRHLRGGPDGPGPQAETATGSTGCKRVGTVFEGIGGGSVEALVRAVYPRSPMCFESGHVRPKTFLLLSEGYVAGTRSPRACTGYDTLERKGIAGA